jgi:threonine dehydrogenase-like Zn-dependent dehydrogenase
VRAAIADGSGAVTLTIVDDPAPRSTEVIVQVDSCGICGTDLHIIDGDYPAARTPIVPGHEIAGTIVARGQAARHLEEGVFVVVDPVVECGYCDQCRSGRTNLCVNWQGYGVTEPGGFAEFVRVRAVDVEPIPPSVPHEWATLVEPVSCALHALDRIGPIRAADRALVISLSNGVRVASVALRPDHLPAVALRIQANDRFLLQELRRFIRRGFQPVPYRRDGIDIRLDGE